MHPGNPRNGTSRAQGRAAPLIVFDASTLVGAAMNADGIPYRAFRKARATNDVILSRPVFEEIKEVLNRPRLARFLDPELRDDVLDQLISGAAWRAPGIAVTDCRDPDNNYLELALEARAGVIVSGDNDLLALDPWRGVRILRPADYLAAT